MPNPPAPEMPDVYCCATMLENVERTCDEHPDRWGCSEAVIGYFSDRRETGLIVHDGGHAMLQIDFCPWCGVDLAEGRVAAEDQDAQGWPVSRTTPRSVAE